MSERLLSIPVILGTPRKGRASENVARFVLGEIQKRGDVVTQLVDVLDYEFPRDDAGTNMANPALADLIARCDGLVIVVPEYNHGYPGALKTLLDTNWKEYIHKAVGVCGVSAGGFGGTRVIQNLLPVMRELGLVTIFWDGNFSNAQKLFDADGKITQDFYIKQMDKFINELVWMARTLRYGRENITLE